MQVKAQELARDNLLGHDRLTTLVMVLQSPYRHTLNWDETCLELRLVVHGHLPREPADA